MPDDIRWEMLPVSSGQPDGPARRRRLPRIARSRRAIGVVVVIAVLAAAGGVAAATSGAGHGNWRTTPVRPGTVEQTVASTGTVTAVNQADLTFPVSGTVDGVDVKVGDKVAAGQVLATLSDASLRQQVLAAQSTLAAAQTKLAADQQSEMTGTASTAGNSTSGGAASGSAASGGSIRLSAAVSPTASVPAAGVSTTPAHDNGTVTAVLVAATTSRSASSGSPSDAQSLVKQDQSALIAAVQQADDLLTAVRGLIASEQTACSAFLGQLDSATGSSGTRYTTSVYRTGSTTPSGAGSSSTSSGSSGGSGQPSGPGSSGAAPDGSHCASLITQVLNAQTSVSSAQAAVKTKAGALDAAVGALLDQTGSSGRTPVRTGGSSSPSGQTASGSRSGSGAAAPSGGRSSGAKSGSAAQRSGGTSGGSGGTSGKTGGTGASGGRAGGQVATAEDVVADQAAVDAAGLELTVAQQAARQAQLVSPINGTVGALDLTKGEAVSAGSSSSTPSVVVTGSGGYEVSTTVTDLDLDQVKVGSSVHVTPDESGQEVDGTVTSIGILPTTSGSSSSSTSGGSATYPVTISLADASLDLHSGTSADVAIVLARATSAITIPTSAVHRLGTGSFVYVLRGGKETTVRVALGAVGPELTQVTSGLAADDQVVLANLDAAIPTSTTATTRIGRTASGLGGGSRATGG